MNFKKSRVRNEEENVRKEEGKVRKNGNFMGRKE